MPSPYRTVRAAPTKPLLIFDGDCHFCRRWIERWRELTGAAVEYAAYQDVSERFPEISIADFQRAVQLIEDDGTIYSGAEAVFKSLGHARHRKWMSWSYECVPGFARTTETAYWLIARNRESASFLTKLLWGKDVRRPTYLDSRGWFLRSLGCIYLIAFLSLWIQVDGLIGASGIEPVTEYLSAAKEQLGSSALFRLPTLCWVNSSDAFLHFLCAAGAITSILLIAGLIPILSLILLLVFYLSLTVAGQTFLSFQWDILLIETGFFAIFFAPLSWSLRHAREAPVSRIAHFLLKLILFKLMLMSGIVKLTSGDDSWGWVDHSFHWSALTALDYHYWTQPLPTTFAWWADKHPEWFKHFSVALCLFIEIIVPIFIWAPRRLRLIACGLLIFLQIAIAITGNYCFFNLLTIALCLPLIDDATIRFSKERASARLKQDGEWAPRLSIMHWASAAVLLVTLPVNASLIHSAFKPRASKSALIERLSDYLEPFRIVNGYGLFRVMTKSRPEIIVEGSSDGDTWLAYQFRWKPGDVNRPPGWVAPHQPRLDWQMWFAALGGPRQNRWFIGLAARLLQGSRPVSALLAHNPFPDHPPRYIRAMFYDYHFTSTEEHEATGGWWKREERGEYLSPISLKDR